MAIKKNYRGIDIAKFIMAVLVVAIHTNPLKGIKSDFFFTIWNVIVRVAVPYFFMASGYFLFSKLIRETDSSSRLAEIVSYGKRIIKLYIYWTIIFIPLTLYNFMNNETPFYIDFLIFIRGVFLVGENFYSWPLWYLHSMIFSLGIIYILIRLDRKINTILVISILLYIFSMFWTVLMELEFNNEIALYLIKIIKRLIGSGRIFTGLLYIIIGALFVKVESQISKVKLIIVTLLGIIIQLFNFSIISEYHSILLPAVIFYLSLNWNSNSIISGYFYRKCSTVMYFTHMIIFFFFTLIFKEFRYYGWDAFLVSTLIPILITPILIKYEQKFVFLKKIF